MTNITAKQLKKQIRRNDRYKRFSTAVKLNLTRINVDALYEEVMHIAELREASANKVRERANHKKRAQMVIQENMDAQAYRTRLVNINTQCDRVASKVEEVMEKIRDYLSVEYGEEMKGLGRTKEERQSVITSLLAPAQAFVDSMSAIVSAAELIIADIDKQHYALKLTLEGMNFLVTRESILGR